MIKKRAGPGLYLRCIGNPREEGFQGEISIVAGGAAPGRLEPGGTWFDSRLARIVVFDTTTEGKVKFWGSVGDHVGWLGVVFGQFLYN